MIKINLFELFMESEILSYLNNTSNFIRIRNIFENKTLESY